MLFVNTNVSALKGMDYMSSVTERLNRSFEQLSSGSRINSAKDDSAGLQISNRLETQIIGTNQASRNIQDGISAIQIADGAMSEITDIAMRMRQLAVQMSSNTYSQEDRDGAQEEIKALINAANGIAESASLGGEMPLLQGPEVNHAAGSDAYIIGRLTGMLEQSEANIKAYFGLVGDGVDEVQVNLTKPGAVGGVIASVGFAGRDVLTLNADYADFAAPEPNALPIKYIDRVVAHEMVHAVVANQLSTDVSTAIWFNEGLAELIHGADERLDALLATPSDAHAFMSTFAGGFAGDETAYAQSFVAARMLHDEMKAAGYGDGIASFLDYVKPEGRTLDDAFNRFLGMDEAGFISHVANNGGAYIIGNIDYKNEDTGAIGGLDADQMGIKNAKDAVGDSFSYAEQPLEGFKFDWSVAGFTPQEKNTFQLQTGSNAGERSDFSIRGGTAERIGLAGVNVAANARGSIAIVDKALKNIHEIRTELGGTLAELESQLRNNTNTVVNVSDARSRVTDTDFAAATAELTRNQIIQQASSTILAQANQRPNIALSLLR